MYRVVVFLVLMIPVGTRASIDKEDWTVMFSHHLQQPGGPEEIKKIISGWSPDGREYFSTKLAQQISDTYTLHLPIALDTHTSLVFIGAVSNELVFKYAVSDESLENSSLFQDFRPFVLNGICTTPLTAKLLLLDYTVSAAYYDDAMRYQHQYIFTETDCWSLW